ncbi:hypothetical protein PBAC_13610 [Pedobacter glucosidilyticus]|nr:outer membrane beta-barrel protein [Pedobacter glucosidilyticus]KHJ38355.1 hypothetical protein PBAC_13610 [Pedobacter glucosidilyticus]
MKKTIVLLLICFAFKSSFAQLEKGNWLVGGSGSFSSAKYNNDVKYERTILILSPSVGYFFKDKLVVGLKPYYTYQLTAEDSEFANNSEINELGITAFLSYYFFKKTEPFNFFTQVGYGYLWQNYSNNNSDDKYSQNVYEISGGPVYFINQSIGINLFLGYSLADFREIEYKQKRFSTGIGFQIHLTKK